MKIPKYWAKADYSVKDQSGKNLFLTLWRWSDTSVEDAAAQASAAARDAGLNFQQKQELNRYEYGRNPLREEIVQSIKNGDGKEVGVVTRNIYGALILNAANAMFIDIDFPEQGSLGSAARSLGKLFGGKAPSPEQAYLASIEQWAQQQPDWGIRVYRTFGGLRCLVTNEVFDPTQENALDVLRSLQSDPLYIKLCRAQESFRARLTPKPWRCNAARPPARYPFKDQNQERRYRNWEQDYRQASSDYTVCRLVKQIGKDETHPDIAPILSLHDQMACTGDELNLA